MSGGVCTHDEESRGPSSAKGEILGGGDSTFWGKGDGSRGDQGGDKGEGGVSCMFLGSGFLHNLYREVKVGVGGGGKACGRRN